jgi:hypothetical protein
LLFCAVRLVQTRADLLHAAVLPRPCCRGIADLVSEAVLREAASDSNLKVRHGSEPGVRVCVLDTLYACVVSQDARDAKKLIGHVDRKLVKQARATRVWRHRQQFDARRRRRQRALTRPTTCAPQTVMTSVYGVTFMGARDQIWNRQARAHRLFYKARVQFLTCCKTAPG